MKTISLVLFGCLFLAGCQTAESNNTSAQLLDLNFSNMQCNEIQKVFINYQQQIEDMDTDPELLILPTAKYKAEKIKNDMTNNYKMAKERAIPVMMIKACSETL